METTKEKIDEIEQKEEKLSAEDQKMIKMLESGKLPEEKNKEEAYFIKDNEKYKWYLQNLFDIHPNDGVIWKDYPVISKQRRVILAVLKQMGSNLLKGKSIMNVSLPITIMEPYSIHQRLVNTFCNLPAFLPKLISASDPIEKFKFYVAFCISTMHVNLSQRKPLNPVLGETYQGFIGSEKIRVDCEQISHHPPISSMVLENEFMTIYSTRYIEANTYPNSALIKEQHNETIIFKDAPKTKYKILQFPDLKVSGIMMGRRLLSFQGNFTIADCTNKLYAQVRFDPEKQGFFEKIFKKTEGHRPDFYKGFITKNEALLKDQSRKAFYSKEIICYIEGNWLENCKMDGDSYWEVDKVEPAKIITAKNCLESDSTYRKDLRALEKGNEDEAQKCKEEIEDFQRRDRKLRETAMKNMKKK